MGILTDILHTLRLSYDPVADFNGLPVRKVPTTTATPTRTATDKANGLHEAPNGQLFVRKQTTTDGGATVYELDGTDIRTGTNVRPGLTEYDQYIFDQFSRQEKYKHFDLKKYERIKRLAFSQAQGGTPISYRDAAKLPGIKGRRGYSARYLADYYKAMNRALYMEQSGQPLPKGAKTA